MDTKQGLPIVRCDSPEAWEDWLGVHHAASKGIWLKIAGKGAGARTVTHAEALDVALRYGWIDGQTARFDDTFSLRKFTPRSPRSRWSKINRAKATHLIESGRMAPAGLAAVEAARRDGRWVEAYDAQSVAIVPDDLRLELDRNPGAAAFFATLNGRNRYAILYRIQTARKPETRARRIGRFIDMLNRREAPYP